LAIQARDIEFLVVLLVDHPLELGRDFEPSLFVYASWVIAAEHVLLCPWGRKICCVLVLPQRGRLKGPKCRSFLVRSGCFLGCQLQNPLAPLKVSLPPTTATVSATFYHICPHPTPKAFVVNEKVTGRYTEE